MTKGVYLLCKRIYITNIDSLIKRYEYWNIEFTKKCVVDVYDGMGFPCFHLVQ